MQNRVQMKESKCARDILKCTNEKRWKIQAVSFCKNVFPMSITFEVFMSNKKKKTNDLAGKILEFIV